MRRSNTRSKTRRRACPAYGCELRPTRLHGAWVLICFSSTSHLLLIHIYFSCTSHLLLGLRVIQPSRPACSIRVLVQTRGNEDVRARPVTQQRTTNRPFSHRVFESHRVQSRFESPGSVCTPHMSALHMSAEHSKEHYHAAEDGQGVGWPQVQITPRRSSHARRVDASRAQLDRVAAAA